MILSGRNEASLNAVSQECKQIKPNLTVRVLPCDLNDPKSVSRLGTEVAKEAVDVLINNGGVSSRSAFLDTAPEVDESVMRVNFLSGASLAKAVVPGMAKRGKGTVIWIGSNQDRIPLPSRSSYAASKFAVRGYCEALRAELKSSGVTVHLPSPGYVRTNLSISAMKGDGKKHGMMDETTAGG